MVIMNYDAQGQAVSDFEIESVYNGVRNDSFSRDRIVRHFSTENIFIRTNLGLVENDISADTVMYIWNENFMHPNQDGTLNHWPRGFADATMLISEKILGIRWDSVGKQTKKG